MGLYVLLMSMSLNCCHHWAYCSSLRWKMSLESDGGIILTGENRRTRKETWPSATLSTTNPTWTKPGANPDSKVTIRQEVSKRSPKNFERERISQEMSIWKPYSYVQGKVGRWSSTAQSLPMRHASAISWHSLPNSPDLSPKNGCVQSNCLVTPLQNHSPARFLNIISYSHATPDVSPDWYYYDWFICVVQSL
jgi:hypothetical protein